MRSILARFRRPYIAGLPEQLMLMNSLGDGSTLTLDFTTGVLDPRLTFTRDSNATFINSSGLVQYADANMMRNSSWSDSNPVPTSWSGAGNTPTIPATGSRTFTVTTAANSYVAEGGASATGSQGLIYTAAVEVTAVSGSPTYNNTILATASPTGVSWYRNGTSVNGTDAVQTGVISYVFTSGSGSFVRIGLGASGGSVTNQSITMTKPRLMPGVRVDSPYFPSASATNQYQAPRFDYDPTTLAPRGLLIEGSATNLARYSEYIDPNAAPWNVYWFVAGTGASVTPVSQADPAGGTTASRCILGTSGSGRVYNGISTTAGVTYTLSFWARSVSGTTSLAFWHFNSATGNSTAVTIGTSWQRYQVTILGRTGGGFVECGIANLTTNAATIDLWGLQFETGSGASSYIPTGASQGTRNADECSMTGTNFSSWFNATEGAFLAHARRMRTTDVGRIASANDNTANESIDIGASTTGQFIVTDGGSALATITPGTVTANTAFKIAGAFKLNDVQAALGGTLGTPDTGVTMPTVNQLMIGRQAGGSPVYLNGTVSLLKFWPARLPDAQLQSITT